MKLLLPSLCSRGIICSSSSSLSSWRSMSMSMPMATNDWSPRSFRTASPLTNRVLLPRMGSSSPRCRCRCRYCYSTSTTRLSQCSTEESSSDTNTNTNTIVFRGNHHAHHHNEGTTRHYGVRVRTTPRPEPAHRGNAREVPRSEGVLRRKELFGARRRNGGRRNANASANTGRNTGLFHQTGP
mmetsp:Transcript_4741/g.10887  ORF Transcript_4741/g.10887 Transcript_4741/m.10887 type:complete len:183 (+) Transcript_4741:192-740(+)